MALDQGRESIPLFAARLEIPSRTRKESSPNNLLQPPMLDLINSGGQRPGKCFSFQLSSFWLCLFSFLDSRSLKMHFLKHPSLLHRTGTFSPTKGRQKWFPLDSFWLQGFLFLSFGVFRRWRQFWFLWHWKHLGQTTTMAKKHVWGKTTVGLYISPPLPLRHPIWVITRPRCWAKQVDFIHSALSVLLMRRARL